MRAYLSTRGDAHWVVEGFDAFLLGAASAQTPLEMDADGDVVVSHPDSALRAVVHGLKPVEAHGRTVRASAGPVFVRLVRDGSDAGDARVRRGTPSALLLVNLVVDGAPEPRKTVLAQLPVLVGSRLLAHPSPSPIEGGYFIVDGAEKIVMCKETRAFDTPIYTRRGGGAGGRRGAPNNNNSDEEDDDEEEDANPNGAGSAAAVHINSQDNPFRLEWVPSKHTVHAYLPFVLKAPVPADLLFRALDVDDEAAPAPFLAAFDAVLDVVYHEGVHLDDFAIDFPHAALSRAQARAQLADLLTHHTAGVAPETRERLVDGLLQQRLLPFVHASEKQAYILQTSVDLVRLVRGLRDPSDADHPVNKRVETCASMYARLARHALHATWAEYERALGAVRAKNPDVVRPLEAVRHKAFAIMCAALRSGGWRGEPRLTCALSRKASWAEFLSTVCRVRVDVFEQSRDLGPRMVNGANVGKFDVAESREGQSAGLSRDLAVFARVTYPGPASQWAAWLSLIPVDKNTKTKTKRCYLNGRLVRFDACPENVLRLKYERDPYASVAVHADEVHVRTTAGRVVRPVWRLGALSETDWAALRAEHDVAGIDLDAYVRAGRVVFLDAHEEALVSVATDPARVESHHEFMELHPCAVFGLSSACIPFADHNNGARNLFGAHVRHQAAGVALVPPADRDAHVQRETKTWAYYPQRAVCDTELARAMRVHDYPCGFNAVVFIVPDLDNEEDSFTLSKGFVDRGGSRLWSECTLTDTADPAQGVVFAKPLEQLPKACRGADYDKLDSVDGLVAPNTLVIDGDVLVGKVALRGATQTRDLTSLVWRGKRAARVDRVTVTNDAAGRCVVHVRLRWARVPWVGDKFATRHGQKGVVSRVAWQEDMPFSVQTGGYADILVNPHAFPSRKTIGQLLEMLCAKTTCLEPGTGWTEHGCAGTARDCTPFSPAFDERAVRADLKRLGFADHGKESVVCGKTGLVYDALVFAAPVFLQQVVHFVSDKTRARDESGGTNALTMQPSRGRKHDGGIKVGEMEVAAILAHGAAFFLQHQFTHDSDGVRVTVCLLCQNIRSFDEASGQCLVCGRFATKQATTTHTFLLFREYLRCSGMTLNLGCTT